MALIKYTGVSETVVVLDGKRVLIKPNKMFSGPKELATNTDFMLLGSTNEDKKVSRKNRSIKFEIAPRYNYEVDLSLLERSGKPKVSICIVTKDCDKVVQRCINSIGDHVQYEDIEILLCDTGTTDKNVLTYYDFIRQDPRVKIFMGHDYNFSRNNNFLAKEATGELLLFLNNDVFLTYDCVTEMVKYALISNLGCIGHRLVWADKPSFLQHDGQILYDGFGTWAGPGHHNYQVNIKNVSNANAIVEGVTAACLMVRKDTFNKVDGFDEEYHDVLQDVDLNLKIYELGYENLVIRQKHLLHVDHGSRKGDSTPQTPLDYQKLKRDWTSKPFSLRPKPEASILVCATNKAQMKTMVDSLDVKTPHEIVFVNNTQNMMYSAEALNKLIDSSRGDYILCVHQDVTFEQKEIIEAIKLAYMKLGGNAGILGPAGVVSSGTNIKKTSGMDFSSRKAPNNIESFRVQCIDEFCLVMRRASNLRFGEYLDHFHFYGADICCLAMSRGLRNYAYNLNVKHHSGGEGNLKSKNGYTNYILQARKFYRRWGNKYKSVATTTAHFLQGTCYYYLGHLLGLTPFHETINVNGPVKDDPKLKITVDDAPNVFNYISKGNSGTSVVILSKDKPEYIKRCIEGLQKHLSGSFEIVIGDTGSTNKEVLDYYKEIKDKVKVVKAGQYHFSRNNNFLAQQHIKYNRVLFLNNDVFIEEDILTEMNKCWTNEVGIVGLRLLYESGKIQHDGIEMIKNPKTEVVEPVHINLNKEPDIENNKKVQAVTGACMLMPTKLFNEMGGFDEAYKAVFQDVDLCMRVKQKGYDIINCNTASAIHVESGTRNPEINRNDYDFVSNRWGLGRVKEE